MAARRHAAVRVAEEAANAGVDVAAHLLFAPVTDAAVAAPQLPPSLPSAPAAVAAAPEVEALPRRSNQAAQ